MLTVIDEFTRRCMAVAVERRLNADNVLHCLTELFVQHGPPDHIRSDNGSEFTAHTVRAWLGRIGVKTLYIELGSPRTKALIGVGIAATTGGIRTRGSELTRNAGAAHVIVIDGEPAVAR